MTIQHGNKDYYQILLDPNRSMFIKQFAEKKGIKTNAYIRNIIYEHLERNLPKHIYKEADAKDKLAWQESVSRRIKARKNKPK